MPRPASKPHDIEPVARQRMRGHPLYEEDENDMMSSNDRVEGRDAALSRRVPSHDGLEGNGTGHHE